MQTKDELEIDRAPIALNAKNTWALLGYAIRVGKHTARTEIALAQRDIAIAKSKRARSASAKENIDYQIRTHDEVWNLERDKAGEYQQKIDALLREHDIWNRSELSNLASSLGSRRRHNWDDDVRKEKTNA